MSSIEEQARKEEAIRHTKVLDMIYEDMEKDATSLDGKPFNGNTVAEQFGKNMAAIQAIARCLSERIKRSEEIE